MIMFWNQKEVFLGYSVQKFYEVRQILASKEIKYKYNVVNNNNGLGRARAGTFGENMDYSITYYIYVHKKDYDSACAAGRNLI